MKQNTFPLARQQDIVVQQTNEEVLVYDLKTNKALCLNGTSAAIWQLCDGKNDIPAIANQLQTQSKQQIPIELIKMALEKLSNENLIENYQPQLAITKTTRREMIRKVGLATAIALPVITSLVAPSAALAASCLTGLTFCNSNSLFGFPRPIGCYDLQNGYILNPGPPPIIGCSFCNNICVGGATCVGGTCVMTP